MEQKALTTKLIKLIEYIDSRYLYYLIKHGPIEIKLNVNLNNKLVYFFTLFIYSDESKIHIKNIHNYIQTTMIKAKDLAKQMEADAELSDLFYDAIVEALKIKDIE